MKRPEESIGEVLENYVGKVRQLIAGKINRTPALEIAPVRFGEDLIIAIEVLRGPETPYAYMGSNKIFIRRGANNVFPDPDHELPRLVSPTNEVGDYDIGR